MGRSAWTPPKVMCVKVCGRLDTIKDVRDVMDASGAIRAQIVVRLPNLF